MALRIVFMGSPEFAVPSLRALIRAHRVLAVVTQPDRPSGRGLKLSPSPVKQVALEVGLPVLQPERLRQKENRLQIMSYDPDVIIVAAYGQILSSNLLVSPRLGCVNVHASLLPKYRGAAPIAWTVLNRESQSGVTIMQMDEGVDTGAMLAKRAVDLAPDETAGTLHDKLALLGAELLVETLELLQSGSVTPQAQRSDEATTAPMLTKEQGLVDFAWDAAKVDAWIRGMDPWPGAFTFLEGKRVKLFRSCFVDETVSREGEILAIDDRGALVGCGAHTVRISELQLEGKKRLSANALAHGNLIRVGMRFSSNVAS